MDSGIGRKGSLDRISRLPDTVLCHILSFLPTKYAVGTSILSTRWRYLWTCVTSLDLDDSLQFHERDHGSLLRFLDFVNRVLFLNCVSSLEKFSLRLESFCDFDLIDSWIIDVIKRNVQKLELCCGREYYKFFPVLLPQAIFTTKTLVDLTLDGHIFLKVDASVWLPTLKILNLVDLVYDNEGSLQKLFYGCPVLEELRMYRCLSYTRRELNISIPTLKRLMITRFRDGFYRNPHELYKLVINAPQLEYIHLSDYATEEFSLENLSSLLRVCVVIGMPCSRPLRSTNYDSHGRISKLLRGIANAKFLDFFTEVKYADLPTFHNLTHLRLGGIKGWDLLNEFLVCSPNLQVLTLEENRVIGSTKSWTPPPRVPNGLLLHLKEIKIMKFHGEEHDLAVIAYLLKSAQALKKMTIYCRNAESCFLRKLAELPRGSKACQLTFRL